MDADGLADDSLVTTHILEGHGPVMLLDISDRGLGLRRLLEKKVHEG